MNILYLEGCCLKWRNRKKIDGGDPKVGEKERGERESDPNEEGFFGLPRHKSEHS